MNIYCDTRGLKISISSASSDVNGVNKRRNFVSEIFFLVNCFNFAVYRSCNDIYNANPSSVSGVFDLEIGKHHCLMDRSNGSCGEGGWTLALKVDGTKVNISLKLNAFKGGQPSQIAGEFWRYVLKL